MVDTVEIEILAKVNRILEMLEAKDKSSKENHDKINKKLDDLSSKISYLH